MSVERARLDLIVRETYGSVPKHRRTTPERGYRPLRSCTRCGIDTRRPDLCRDCTEVTPS